VTEDLSQNAVDNAPKHQSDSLIFCMGISKTYAALPKRVIIR